MRRVFTIIAASIALMLSACTKPSQTENIFPVLDSLDGTLWYSLDNGDSLNIIYYDVIYNAADGAMIGYDTPERTNEIVRREFSYTFTPADAMSDGIVNMEFSDGQRYGGILVPKGVFQINLRDVYIIQLYEVDERGEIIYDVNGNIKSTLQMWRE